MDLVFIITSFLLIALGFIGSFAPVIPGPISAWFGLLILYQTSFLTPDWLFLGGTLAIAILVFVLDYFIPIIGTKKMGGTKSGVMGATLGLLLGMFTLGPLGLLIGPFAGAFVGELINDANDFHTALKAAIGSLIGFMTGVFLKFSVTLIFAFYYVKILWSSPLELFWL
jgi:uncharacterized protein YqgC (DUF456 family)